MSAGNSYRRLDVWTTAMDLVDSVYEICRSFPESERFGLTSQMQRASVSIPANIAEGHGRTGQGEWAYHLSVARGSLYELETLLVIASRRNWADKTALRNAWVLSQRVGKMLSRMLQSKPKQPAKRVSRASSIEHRAS